MPVSDRLETKVETSDKAVVWATYLAPSVAAIVAFILGLLAERWLGRRPRLGWFFGHNSSVAIPNATGEGPALVVNSHSVAIANQGRGPAHNVSVVHVHLEGIHFQVFPITEFVQEPVPGAGGERIRFPRIDPGLTVWIHYLGVNVRTDDITVRCTSDEGQARVVNVGPQRIMPRWFRRFVLAMFFAGTAACVYLAARVVATLARYWLR